MKENAKSFQVNGKTIKKSNFLKFVKSTYSSDYFKSYLTKLLDLHGIWYLDHWASDGSFNSYQVGNEFVTIFREHRELTEKWINE